MKKALSIAVLVTFAWLQGYQLADASEDTAEALQDAIVTCTHSTAHIAINVPDDDYDAAIPWVIGQTLRPSTITLTPTFTFYNGVPTGSLSMPVVSIQKFLKNKSPPGTDLAVQNSFLPTLALDRSPERSLAPPLA